MLKLVNTVQLFFGEAVGTFVKGRIMEIFLLWLLIGTVSGLTARHYAPGYSLYGVTGDLVVGLVGALAGGFFFTSIANSFVDGNPRSLSISGAIVGAAALLSFVRIVGSGRKSI